MAMSMLSRRSFLLGSASIAAMSIAPLPAPARPLMIGADLTADSDMMMWAVGTSGDFNWRPIAARSAKEAYALRFSCDIGEIEDSSFEENVVRVESWDGRRPEEIIPADWIEADLGACCSRCDGECYGPDGAKVVGADVVCPDCMEIFDWVEVDEDHSVELIAVEISEYGEDAARQRIDGADAIPDDIWARAVAEAAKL
jgi:hypothetical protein